MYRGRACIPYEGSEILHSLNGALHLIQVLLLWSPPHRPECSEVVFLLSEKPFLWCHVECCLRDRHGALHWDKTKYNSCSLFFHYDVRTFVNSVSQREFKKERYLGSAEETDERRIAAYVIKLLSSSFDNLQSLSSLIYFVCSPVHFIFLPYIEVSCTLKHLLLFFTSSGWGSD